MVCNGSRPPGVIGTAVLHSHLAGILQMAPLKIGGDILAGTKERTVSKRNCPYVCDFNFEF